MSRHHSSNHSQSSPTTNPETSIRPSTLFAFIRTLLFSALSTSRANIYNLYLITIDDIPTFVVPNTIFGLSSALTPYLLTISTHATNSASPINPPGTNNSPSISLSAFLWATFHTLTFNFLSLTLFDLSNQRLPSSLTEDLLNKPWRPLPRGLLTPRTLRLWLLILIPVVLFYNHAVLDVGVETLIIGVLTWMYNDLGGGDEAWWVRNGIIAVAFGAFNRGSVKVAASSFSSISPPALRWFGGRGEARGVEMSRMGKDWTVMISLVIFSTMHVQDLKDVAGDATRQRRTFPIIYGRRAAGWSVAIAVLFWSVICVWFWIPMGWGVAGLPVGLGMCVAWRCVYLRGVREDRRTWQLWCAWTAVLYLLPPLSRGAVS
jgi:4-hydroxybenzoate polyprenyltransferase